MTDTERRKAQTIPEVKIGSTAGGPASTGAANNQGNNGEMKSKQGNTEGEATNNHGTNNGENNNQEKSGENTRGPGKGQSNQNGEEAKPPLPNPFPAGQELKPGTPLGDCYNILKILEKHFYYAALFNDPDALREFQEETLFCHNQKRGLHAAPALKLDENLNNQAQEWADELARRKVVEHSDHALTVDGKGEGENIAEACLIGGVIPEAGRKMTDMWYKEVQKYDWDNPGFSQAAGHFTQLVWKNTQRIGVGEAKFEKDGYTCDVGVVRYFPEGNVEGQFPENVLKGTQ